MKNKSKINLIIDIAMLLVIMAIAGIGLLIKYVLLPGFKRNIKYDEDVELYFLGIDRHEWGSIHFVLGYILFALLVFHIILHWNLILSTYRNLIKNNFLRKVTSIVLIVLSFILVSFSFLIKPEIEILEKGNYHIKKSKYYTEEVCPDHINMTTIQIMGNDTHIENCNKNKEKDIVVKGYMTLSELAKRYDVPVTYLKEKLKISESTSADMTLGRLRKEYNFKMSDVREIIADYRK